MPTSARLIAVVREEQPLLSPENETLYADDHVYLLANPRDIPEIERLFGTEEALGGPRAEGFYGMFALRGDAHLGEVASLYGIEPDPADADRTLDEFLRSRFGRRIAVGDRVSIGRLEFIVRRVDEERVIEVGLRFRDRQ